MDMSILYNSNGDLVAGIETYKFYENKGLLDLYTYIIDSTYYLNEYNCSVKERIFYIKNNFQTIQLCTVCQKKKKRYRSNIKDLTKTCGSCECINYLKINSLTSSHVRDRSYLYTTRKCKCGNENIVLKKSKKKFCSRKCYVNYREYSHSESTKQKIRESNIKIHNDVNWRNSKKEIYLAAHKKLSDTMKRKIANGEFTPIITNSRTHWKADIIIDNKTIQFRSFWEAAFFILNRDLKYEKIRIPYIFAGSNHSYIVDFVDETYKILYEIKPNSTKESDLNRIKFKAAELWCKENGYTFTIISDEWFLKNAADIDYTKYPDQLYKSMKQFLK